MSAAQSTAPQGGEGATDPAGTPATGAAKQTTTTAAPAKGEEADEAPRPRPGYVKEIATGTFHHVDDVPSVLRAYPEQFEKVAKTAVDEKKVGWPQETAAKAD